MVQLNKITNIIQLSAGTLPVILSVAFLVKQSWLMLLFCILSLFAVIAFVPLFKRRESLYMFIFTGLVGLPINVRLAYWLISEEFIYPGSFIGSILWGAFLCCVFFSVEEIAFGVITRMIWKRQYKIKI